MYELFSELWKDEFITVDINVLRYSTNQRFKKAEISILKQSIGANHAEYLAPKYPIRDNETANDTDSGIVEVFQVNRMRKLIGKLLKRRVNGLTRLKC